MLQTLLTISLFAAVGAFAVASVLLNEGRHADRKRGRMRAALERRRRAAWSPALVSPCPELPPRPQPRSELSRRVAVLFGRVGSGVEALPPREVKRAFLASVLIALAAVLRAPARRGAASARRAIKPTRSRWAALTPGRGSPRRGRTPSLHW